MNHLLSMCDLSADAVDQIFAITQDLKTKLRRGVREPLLPGRVLALLFEKPSLRTRVSFEAGMVHLGGGSIFLSDDVGFGKRESIADFGRVLSQYADGIVIRFKSHQVAVDLAGHCSAAVINGLTDYEHPCQAMADLYTLRELVGPLAGHTMVYVGDGNNVARSLAIGCARVGMRFVLASPEAYRFDDEFLDVLQREAPGLDLTQSSDPAGAVAQATAVYTDVWTSMGQEKERESRRRDFAEFQVNGALMQAAPPTAYFMHCLPAKRGEEVTDEVIDGPQSVVIEQAANRMHVQKGILAWLLAGDDS